ncbi:PAS domain S-box protein [Oceanobacillus halotolerans]|uniref:PAS domain S-box protein n=1 Tax=Oceanobacillus halotolerans TaxID=2663380 RepID=UPI0013DB68A8|nr:PAS domain S-box protein [Oceanobacillus halotolerans]
MVREFLHKMAQNGQTFLDMVNSIEDLIFVMKQDGQSFRYVYVNLAGLEKLDVDESILGQTIEDVVPREIAATLTSKYHQAVKTKQPIYFEEILYKREGEMIGETLLNPVVTTDENCEYVFAIVRDVTDRRQKEQQLSEIKKRVERNQKRIESLATYNGDAVFEIDAKGNFVTVNNKVTELTGYEEEELIGQSSFQLIVKEDLPRTRANFRRALQGDPIEYEIWIHHKDGQRLLLQLKNIPIIVDGVLEGVYGIATDITEKRKMENDLENLKNELQIVWDHSTDAIFLLSYDGKIISINPAFEEMFGYTKEEVRDTNQIVFFPFHEMGNVTEYLEPLRRGEKIINLDVQRYTKDGRLLDIIASYMPANKGHILAVGMYKDITDRKKIQERLEENEKGYRQIVELSPEAIVIFKEYRINYFNKTSVDLFGITQEEVLDTSLLQYIHNRDQARFDQFIDQVKSLKHHDLDELDPIEVRIIQPDETVVHTAVSAAPIQKGGEKFIQAIFRDISERKKQEEQLTFMAYHDPLTGLKNRRAFSDEMEQAIEKALSNKEMLAVLYLDMDNFKEINDALGHEIGDELLIQFANRLSQNVRGDDVLCRIGGDEFLILLTHITTKERVIEIAERLQHSLQDHYEINGNDLQVTSSFGIALYPEDGWSAKLLIHHADAALYQAKEVRNRYQFYSRNGITE